MFRIFLMLSIGAAALLVRPVPADACGLKVASSAPRTRKLTQQSQRPSQVLLLGDHSGRTASVLFEAGHNVELSPDAASARGQNYHVVVVDEGREDEARQAWPDIIVVSGAGNSNDILARIEDELDRKPARRLVARRPSRSSEGPLAGPRSTGGRRLVATGGNKEPTRTPIAAGGSTSESAVVSGEGAAASGEADQADQADQADEASTERVEVAAIEQPVEEADTRPRARSRRGFTRRIYFKNASTELTRRFKAKLSKNARWLARHADKEVAIEGHASALGVPKLNDALSRARAEKVKEFLIEKGVDASRLEIKWFGMKRPEFKPGSNPRNRRVVLVIEP
jgi:outer membrane protein OmpA-like peptidoglycan-associated protein